MVMTGCIVAHSHLRHQWHSSLGEQQPVLVAVSMEEGGEQGSVC